MFIDGLLNKVLAPFRQVFSHIMRVRTVKSGIQGDARRVKMLGARAKNEVKAAKDQAAKLAGQAKDAQGKATAAAGQAQGAVGQAQGAVGQAQQAVDGKSKKAKKKMGLFGKKNVCPNCGQVQDKSWDKCPFCANLGGAVPGGAGGPPPGAPQHGGAAPAAVGGGFAPPAGGSAQKTVAFMAGTGAGAAMQLLGWIIPLKGPHRGELHTLKAATTVGKDPTCDVVFADPYMSSRHATLRAQNGIYILEDHSTNGTFVNDKKVKTHELVDNDFIKFGQTLVKFKAL